MNACLHIEVPRRRIEGGSFADPRRVGLLKKEEGWLRSCLGSDISIEEDEVERVDVTRAIEDPKLNIFVLTSLIDWWLLKKPV